MVTVPKALIAETINVVAVLCGHGSDRRVAELAAIIVLIPPQATIACCPPGRAAILRLLEIHHDRAVAADTTCPYRRYRASCPGFRLVNALGDEGERLRTTWRPANVQSPVCIEGR